jgi:hypothetical protein
MPEAHAAIVANDNLEATLARADMHTFLHQICSADVEAEHTRAASFPAAYTSMATHDILEAELARSDGEKFHAGADVLQDALDDQYEATLAKADLCALQRRTDVAEFAPRMTAIDDLPVRAFSYMRKLPRCTDIVQGQSWAAALPEAYSAIAEDDKFEAVLACVDSRDLQSRSDAAEDIMEQQLWAAELPEAFKDAVEKDKLEAALACIDMHSFQNRTEMKQERVWTVALPQVLVAAAESDKEEAVFAGDATSTRASSKSTNHSSADTEGELMDVFAGADQMECQKRMHLSLPLSESPDFADSCEQSVLDGNQSVNQQKTVDDWARQVSECSTTASDGFVRLVSVPESPPMAF